MLLYDTIHRSQTKGTILQIFTINYTVWFWNRLPTKDSGYSFEEILSHFKPTHVNLNIVSILGSPLYVLDPRLQDEKKIRKQEKRSITGIFIGFSPFNYSTISLALNITIGSVSSQFHVVYDELITTTHSFGDSNMNVLWDEVNIISC